jgi:hypothetical protein
MRRRKRRRLERDYLALLMKGDRRKMSSARYGDGGQFQLQYRGQLRNRKLVWIRIYSQHRDGGNKQTVHQKLQAKEGYEPFLPALRIAEQQQSRVYLIQNVSQATSVHSIVDLACFV